MPAHPEEFVSATGTERRFSTVQPGYIRAAAAFRTIYRMRRQGFVAAVAAKAVGDIFGKRLHRESGKYKWRHYKGKKAIHPIRMQNRQVRQYEQTLVVRQKYFLSVCPPTAEPI
ncbi:hypothetical protein NEILACOT_03022 [Neisseria lactamica ATCC 23970]|uniref:Uncharacterized protein n=1 Tax=Neisseria lactamica ATCC 23970 TaxID=546265 RepID=D0W686_NEILA|nr:hypothetical protein NEILACOT_03022 [Neisseria lactamica ATCC 23970]